MSKDMTNKEMIDIEKKIGEKWHIYYLDKDLTTQFIMANNYKCVLTAIEFVRENKGSDIRIEDKTPWRLSSWYSDKEI